jgi:hypothetical protein
MAVGHSAAEAAKIVSTGSNTALDGSYIKLHTGDPGAAGTANAATETTRKQISLGTPSGGVVTNDTAITWTSIAGSEDATHFSLWTAATAGTFLFSGTITAAAYTAGDTYEIAIGGLTITHSTVAA